MRLPPIPIVGPETSRTSLRAPPSGRSSWAGIAGLRAGRGAVPRESAQPALGCSGAAEALGLGNEGASK